MNCSTTVLAFTLLSRLVFCSSPEYRAVCETEYSSVLKHFYDSVTHFHYCLQKWPSDPEFVNCLQKKGIAKEHFNRVISIDSELNSKTINLIHERVCKKLNERAEHVELPKDIPSIYYDVFNDSASIKDLFRTLRIGIKIKTREKDILKKMIDATNLLTKHSKLIKRCLHTRDSFELFDFRNCLSSIEKGKLLDYVYDLPLIVMEKYGSPYDFNDIDLIIELNELLYFKFRELSQNREIVYSSQDRINELVEYDTGKQEDQFDWIIKATCMFGAVIILVVLAYYIREKRKDRSERQ